MPDPVSNRGAPRLQPGQIDLNSPATHTNSGLRVRSPGPPSSYRQPSLVTSLKGAFQPAPMLNLRLDPMNTIRLPGEQPQTMGQALQSIERFIFTKLRENTPQGKGAQIIKYLGSFPGNRFPELSLADWNVDKKIDLNVIGNAEVMLRKFAPFMGWDQATLEHNLALAKQGMVYYNVAMETAQGPIPFKMGMLDHKLWEASFEGHSGERPRGFPYYGLRASLLPLTVGEGGTYRLVDARLQKVFLEQIRLVQADYMGHALDSFVWRESFTGEQLAARRYFRQFVSYDFWRAFGEFPKGRKQRRRYGEQVPEILAPATRQALLDRPGAFRIEDAQGNKLAPEQITAENFYDLRFISERSFGERRAAAKQAKQESQWVAARNKEQTVLNISSNRTTRDNPHKPHWFAYFLRKIKLGTLAGFPPELHPRVYHPSASYFTEPLQRLFGYHANNPLDQVGVVAGYNPGGWEDPKVWVGGKIKKGVMPYSEAEIRKGKKFNLNFAGNAPSKFTLPIRGVPLVAYPLMDALKSEAMKHVVVVGVPDVVVIAEAFKKYYAKEIEQRGKTFTIIDVGPGGGSLGKNTQAVLDKLPNKDKGAVLVFGDVQADLENMAYQPSRHSADYIFGANGQGMLTSFLGMNAHYQMDWEGMAIPFKEGNISVRRKGRIDKFMAALFDGMYGNRKSVDVGGGTKVDVFLGAVFGVGGVLFNPNNPIHLGHALLDFGWRTGRNTLYRLTGLGKPPWRAASVELIEKVVADVLGWKADFRPRHLDLKSVLDGDGIRDYVLRLWLAKRYPHPYQSELETFAKEGLMGEVRKQLPLLDNVPKFINNAVVKFYRDVLAREAARPEGKKLGITPEKLIELGVDPYTPVLLEDGSPNPDSKLISAEEIQEAVRALQAYDHRGKHAETLSERFDAEFAKFRQVQGLDAKSREQYRSVEHWILKTFNQAPELYRGYLLEWDNSRLQDALIEQAKQDAASNKVKNLTPDFVSGYFKLKDTPLKRMLLGMKAVDVLRRYSIHIAPEEYRTLYPRLIEAMHLAQEVVGEYRPKTAAVNGPWGKGYFLNQLFVTAQRNADRLYVRKVGESPPPYRSRGLSRAFPHSNNRPSTLRDSQGNLRRVDAPILLPRDISYTAHQLEILPSRLPHLMAAASGADSRDKLNLVSGASATADQKAVPGQRMGFERLNAWAQSEAGQEYLKANPQLKDTLFNRLREGGPGLATSIASLLVFTQVANALGIDPRYYPHEHFATVVAPSHVVGKVVGAINEVSINRGLNAPFDFVTARNVNAGSELALQYSLQARSNAWAAGFDSLRRNFTFQEGWKDALKRGGAFPARMAWGMGPGLMSSAAVDLVVSQGMLGLEPDSSLRSAIHFGSFFAPEAYHLWVGNRAPALFQTSLLRGAAGAFSAGFIADMLFMGYNRCEYGSQGAVQRNMIFQMANEFQDQELGTFASIVDGAFEMIAPSIAAWWSGVDWTGAPNEYYYQARDTLTQQANFVEQNARRLIYARLLNDLNNTGKVDFSFLRGENSLEEKSPSGKPLPIRAFLDALRDASLAKKFNGLSAPEKRIKFVQQRYSGWKLNKSDVETMLSRVSLYWMRSDLKGLKDMPPLLPGTESIARFFDEEGNLVNSRSAEQGLLETLFGSPAASPIATIY